jgi:hypothetical protein
MLEKSSKSIEFHVRVIASVSWCCSALHVVRQKHETITEHHVITVLPEHHSDQPNANEKEIKTQNYILCFFEF